MFRILLPDGTFVTANTKAEAYKIIAEMRENYEGYLS